MREMMTRETDQAEKQSDIAALWAARDLLKDRRKWCAGVMAMDNMGREVRPMNPDAVRWCLMGAVCKYTALYQRARIAERLHRLGRKHYLWSEAWMVNDREGYSEAMNLLGFAIVELRSEISRSA